jgi:hypothetical protein
VEQKGGQQGSRSAGQQSGRAALGEVNVSYRPGWVLHKALGCSSALSRHAAAAGVPLPYCRRAHTRLVQGSKLTSGCKQACVCTPVVGVGVDARDSGAQVCRQVSEVTQCVTHTELLKGCNLGVLQAWLLQQCTQHLQRGSHGGLQHAVKRSCVREHCMVAHSAGAKAAGWLCLTQCVLMHTGSGCLHYDLVYLHPVLWPSPSVPCSW